MRAMRAAECILMLCLGSAELRAEAQPEKNSIRAEDLGSKVQVVGRLQQPLGTVVQIEGTIVDGESLRMKQYQGAYLLRVESVAGKRLGSPPIMRFGSDSRLLSADAFELYESKHGKKPGSLADTEIRELNKGYVGQRFTLLAYETGGFGGIPKNLPTELIWQDTSYQFSTHLVLLKRITSDAELAPGKSPVMQGK